MCGLCTHHHDATHVGTLVIRGTVLERLVFEYADGERYGSKSASPARAQVLATVLQLLVGMG